jgi:hypothetical protein
VLQVSLPPVGSDWSVRYDHPLERVRVFAISASC